MDPAKHNYHEKLIQLHEQGQIPSGSLTEVDICHDDWCAIYKGGYCNCDPDINLRLPPSRLGRGVGLRQEAESSAKSPLSEDTHQLRHPSAPCPHCGSEEFLLWRAAQDPMRQAISCNGCGAVMSSTHPLDPDDRPMRRP
jgi:hypothetical protein